MTITEKEGGCRVGLTRTVIEDLSVTRAARLLGTEQAWVEALCYISVCIRA